MLKRMCQMASLLLLAGLIFTSPVVAGQSAQAFRQQNGLLAYAPPAWVLEGYFLAREKNPAYVFGPVRDFVAALGGTPTWLIEDLELKRLQEAGAAGKQPEYTLFLEVVLPERAQYWAFEWSASTHDSCTGQIIFSRALHSSTGFTPIRPKRTCHIHF